MEFTIKVKNNGPNPAIRISTTFQIPNQLEYINDTSEGAYNPDTGVWYIRSLEVNAEKTIKIITKVTDYGAITNTASITSASEDNNPLNDESTVLINANKIIDLKMGQITLLILLILDILV